MNKQTSIFFTSLFLSAMAAIAADIHVSRDLTVTRSGLIGEKSRILRVSLPSVDPSGQKGQTAYLGFFRQTLPALPSTQLAKATLWIYVSRIDGRGALSLHSCPGLTETVSQSLTILPTVEEPVATFSLAGPSGYTRGYIPVDVSDLVKGWLDGEPVTGIVIAPAVPDSEGLLREFRGVVEFESREGAHPPYLDLTFTR